MEVLLTTKDKRLREPYSQRPWTELYSFMKYISSCQFFRGLWMDMSGEIAEIHMWTDAKNLVTTARTIHLFEEKEIIHMISMLRKEDSSGNIHDFALISTQNSLADCLTKSSAKADNLCTAVKTRRYLEFDVHPNFRTLMEYKAFLSTCCTTFMYKREIKVFFLSTLKISLSSASREEPFHVMFVRTSMDSESQDATKITSALADPRICSFMKMMTLGMHMNAFTNFLSVSQSFSSSVRTMLTSSLAGVRMTNNSYQESVLEDFDFPFLEDFYCKEERQYVSDFESEDDEWPGTENQWCPSLDLQ